MGRVLTNAAPADGIEDDTNYRMRPAQLREPEHQASETEFIDPTELRPSMDEYFHDESNLAAPPARPGYRQYWKRMAFNNGEIDQKNWSKAMRQGWTPRDPATVTVGRNFWPIRNFEGREVIQVGGLVLCEMPLAMHRRLEQDVKQANDRLKIMTRQDQDAANAEGIRIGGSNAPRIVREEDVRSSGSRPPTMAD